MKPHIQNDKYESTGETIVHLGFTLYRIRARKAFGIVVAGSIGGFIASEKNLHVSGDAWVFGNARVYGDAQVYGDAWVFGNAWVFGDAQVSGNARVSGDARVYGDAQVSGNARVSGDARVYGDAQVFGDAWVFGNAQVSGNARVSGDAQVYGDARVYGNAHYLTISPIGSEAGCLTAFLQKDGSILFNRGCFSGTKDELLAAVKSKHSDSGIAKQYELCVALAEARLKP